MLTRLFWASRPLSWVNTAYPFTAAVLLTRGAPPEQVAPRLVVAYGSAYAVGAWLSSVLLSRTVGGLAGKVLLRFLVRLALAVAVSGVVGWGLRELLEQLLPGSGTLTAVAQLGGVGLGFLLVYVLMARALRITEVSDVMSLVTRRLLR